MSLRATMIAVLLFGGGLGWLARRAHLQRRAVAAITARGGRVTYDWAMRDPRTGRRAAKGPPGPAWLRRWAGDEFFQEVAFVALHQPATPEDMAIVAGFGHLERLSVTEVAGVGDGLGRLAGIATLRALQIGTSPTGKTGLTDAILAPVDRLTSLRELQLIKGDITGAGLDSLQHLTALETFRLYDCPQVTSAGLARLIDRSLKLVDLDLVNLNVDDAIMPAVGRLRHLKVLDLTKTGVTDAGMAPLAGSTSLETLQMRLTAIGDVGLAHLGGLTGLQRLMAGGTPISDAGLVHLGRLTGLTELELTGTKITDAGLFHLAPLQNLRSLTAATTAITDAGTPALARLGGLRSLTLTRTKVTDAGLPPLADLKQLVELSVQDTTVTPHGEGEFRRLLPTLRSFRRGAYARPASARSAAARPGPGGSPPAQPSRPGSRTNRPDDSAPPDSSTKGAAGGSSSEPQPRPRASKGPEPTGGS